MQNLVLGELKENGKNLNQDQLEEVQEEQTGEITTNHVF